MTLKLIKSREFHGIRVKVMIDKKERFRSFSFRRGPRGRAQEVDAKTRKELTAEANNLHDSWLKEQAEVRQAVQKESKATRRNKTTPVKGISASVYRVRPNSVNEGKTYWRFQVGAGSKGSFRSRSIHVTRGKEEEAWVKACQELAAIRGADAAEYIKMWPGRKKIEAIFLALENK